MKFSYSVAVACIAAVSAAYDPEYNFMKELEKHWTGKEEADKQELMKALFETVVHLRDTAAQRDSRISALEEQLEAQADALKAQNAANDFQQQQLDGALQQIGILGPLVSAHGNAIEGLEPLVDSHQTTITDQGNQIDSLEDAKQDFTNQFTQIDTFKTTTNTAISTLTYAKGQLLDRVSALEGTSVEHTGDLVALALRQRLAGAEIDALDAQQVEVDDYFWSNDAGFWLSDGELCFRKFSVAPGNTIDFNANLSTFANRAADGTLIAHLELKKDGQRAALANYTTANTSSEIIPLSLHHKERVEGTTYAEFELCLFGLTNGGQVSVENGMFQVGYTVYGTGDNYHFHRINNLLA